MNDPEFLSTAEVARTLRVSPVTLRRWRMRGLGPVFVMLGGAPRYRPSDVHAYVEARTFQSTTEAGRNRPVKAVVDSERGRS